MFGGKANTTQENTSPEKPLDDKKHVNDQSKGNTVRIVNNEEVTTESEKFYDAEEELDDDFHDAREEDFVMC
ncbi:hypothetical protein [Wolbachia endosymbiont (group B) of Ischnura elegans]|uniref:hypothetical protein n=1 Tax=Wolbachia endosymbiont (group B) of Ischnura elegans TaxID=2954021 RepID=UPI00222F09C7|nr:hypothetical protein [Wolbachia endosymbiont (group B) of Ischnura elegans]